MILLSVASEGSGKLFTPQSILSALTDILSFESSLVPSEALGFSELFVTFRRFLVALEFDFFFGKIGWLLVYKKIEQYKSVKRSKPLKLKWI